MTKALERRIAELERKQAGSLRQRIVWWDEGKPKPQAEPGEQLERFRADRNLFPIHRIART